MTTQFDDLPMRFGAHNLHENRAGSYRSERIVFATYFSAGVRVYDLADPARPAEVAHWVPEPPPAKPSRRSTTCSSTNPAWSGPPTGSPAASMSWSPSRPWPPSWPKPGQTSRCDDSIFITDEGTSHP